MQTFPGKIGFVDDPSGDMVADITVTDETLVIASGDTAIGTWPIGEIDLELGTRGFLATLDGEQLLLAPHDRFGFTTAVEEAQEAAAAPTSRRQAKKKAKASAKAAAKEEREAAEQAKATAAAITKAEQIASNGASQTAAPAEPSKKEQRQQKKAEAKALKAARKKEATERNEDTIVVPGLEDPDKDALWATHRTREPSSWRERLNSTTGVRKVLIATAVLLIVGTVFVPAVVSFILLIPGVIAVVLGGLALLDPAYTRFLPGSFSELRLMLIGITFFAVSLLVATLR